MIYLPSLELAFCHVPRTSGISVTDALQRAFPDAVVDISPTGIHWTVPTIREHFPAARIFAIIRNPWRIFQSNYGWHRRYEGEVRPFEEALDSMLMWDWPCREPGFFASFLDDDTIVFRYEDDPYQQISQLVGRELTFERLNETVHPAPVWTEQMIDLVAQRCRDDIRRFGYGPPVI